MLGAIAGDIIGSSYEFFGNKNLDFELFLPCSIFTDDTVLTVAVADCILNEKDYALTLKHYGLKYPNSGYGVRFFDWLWRKDNAPYNSFGNGSAMRVSPVGFAFSTLDKVLFEAKRSAEVTHNHPEGIKGAQSTAAAIFLARQGQSKQYIKEYIENKFNYDLTRKLDDIRPNYQFDETCQGSVPEAIIAFLESNDYEDAIRKAISLGGDTDTQACIAGGIAQAFYKSIPKTIVEKVYEILDPEQLQIVQEFNVRYNIQF